MTIRANWNTGDSFTATDANTLANDLRTKLIALGIIAAT